jgi:16S rRNA (guanine966-N2)-methyltransferase
MSVKILGGIARGFPLLTPKTELTRPTSVIVRRKLFDWRQNLQGMIFIDLCAGSGAVGLEALSRGADKVFLNDHHRASFQCLLKNQEKISTAFKFEKSSIVVSTIEARSWIQRELNYQLIDTEDVILYLDPPYEDHKLYFDILSSLKEKNFKGEIWLEADRLKGPAKTNFIGLFHSVIKEVEQGDHFVLVGKLS